jgi:excisionase family DNA binding protein
MMNIDDFLTIKEVAKKMRVSGMTVYRMVQSGELSAIRFGKSYRIPFTVLKEYIDSRYKVSNG